MRNSQLNFTLPTAIVMLAVTLSACQPAHTSAPTSPPPTLTAPAPNPVPPTPLPPTATTLPRTAALSELQNEVKARAVADAQWESAADGQLVSAGGGVRTGDEARARLDISDGTIIRLAAHSAFELSELSPMATDTVTRLRLTAGKLWAAVTQALGGGEFEIETPAGLATVRGSYMSVEYSDATGQMIVTCLEGQCHLTGASGKFTELSDGQQSKIAAAGQDPAPATKMDAVQYADWAQNFPEAPLPILTPTSTDSPTLVIPSGPPRPTVTPTVKPSSTNTSIPTAVFSATPSFAFVHLTPTPGGGASVCTPDTVPAGLIVLDMGVGRWASPEEATAAVGDSWPSVTGNGQPASRHSRSDVSPQTGVGLPDGWGFDARMQITLGPGVYNMDWQWVHPDVYTCTITVVGP